MRLYGRSELAGINDYIEATQKIDRKLSQEPQITIQSNLQNIFLMLASWIDPVDLSTGEVLDKENYSKLSMALSQGAILGYHLNVLAYAPSSVTAHDMVENITAKSDPSIKDPLLYDSVRASLLVESGNQTMTELGDEVNDWIVEYEESLVKDVTLQRYVRTGCGIVTAATTRAFALAIKEEENERTLQSMRDYLDQDDTHIDWDSFDWSQPGKNS